MENNKLNKMTDIVESTKGVFDMDGTCWRDRLFSHPERTIRIATSFSGIGAPERALERLGLNTQIVFACDIGERYLNYNYERLAQFTVCLSEEDKQLFAQYLYDKNEKKVKEKRQQGHENAGTTNPFTLEEVKENLYGDKITEPKVELELVKECIDLITRNMSHLERERFVNNLFDEKGRNYIKDAFFANHNIKEENWYTDIRFMDATPYKGQVDLYVSGSPCCSFSKSGLKLGLEDTRGTLFYDFAKRIQECEPKVFVYENVANMTNSGLEVVLSVFQKLGYKIYWQKLIAKNYGVPQNRDRVWVVGFRKDLAENLDFKYPAPIPLKSRLYDYLDSDILPRSGWVNKPHVRRLTGSECLRLMGFHDFNIPDSFYKHLKSDISINKKMCEFAGNSMVVECLMALFLQMDITQYGVELNDIKNNISDKPLDEMTTVELVNRIETCVDLPNNKHEVQKYNCFNENKRHIPITLVCNDVNPNTIPRQKGSEPIIDWGLIDKHSLVPENFAENSLECLGATYRSKKTGKIGQDMTIYSVRGICSTISRNNAPTILVSNVVRANSKPTKDESKPIVDWGLIDKPSAVPLGLRTDNLCKVGSTSYSQTDRIYSMRGISPTLVKFPPPLTLVTNMVNNQTRIMEESRLSV